MYYLILKNTYTLTKDYRIQPFTKINLFIFWNNCNFYFFWLINGVIWWKNGQNKVLSPELW